MKLEPINASYKALATGYSKGETTIIATNTHAYYAKFHVTTSTKILVKDNMELQPANNIYIFKGSSIHFTLFNYNNDQKQRMFSNIGKPNYTNLFFFIFTKQLQQK